MTKKYIIIILLLLIVSFFIAYEVKETHKNIESLEKEIDNINIQIHNYYTDTITNSTNFLKP